MHHLDHLIALQHGGATTDANLALACIECNQSKGADLAAIDQGERVVVWYRVLLDDGRQGWVAQPSQRGEISGVERSQYFAVQCVVNCSQAAATDRNVRTPYGMAQ